LISYPPWGPPACKNKPYKTPQKYIYIYIKNKELHAHESHQTIPQFSTLFE
jgi:hypothetical protein